MFLRNYGFCNHIKIDSLKNILSDALSDEERINVYYELLPLLSSNETQEFYKQAKKICSKSKNSQWLNKVELGYGNALANDDQKKAIDHLNRILKPKENWLDDPLFTSAATKLAHLYNLSGAYAVSDSICDSTLKHLRKSGRGKGYSLLCYYKSLNNRALGKPHVALEYLDSAYVIASRDDINFLGSLYNSKGRIYRGLAKYDSSKVYYEKALETGRLMKDQVFVSKALNNLGNVAHSRGQLDEALNYYLKSLNIKNELQNEKGICVGFHNVGAVRYDLKSFETALEDFKKSLALAEKTNYKILVFYNLLKIGNCHSELGDVDKAIQLHQRALDLASEMSLKSGIISARINLAEDFIRREQYERAIGELLAAISLSEKTSNRAALSAALIILAETYIEIDKSSIQDGRRVLVDNKNRDIERLLKQGAQIAQETGNFIGLEKSLSALRSFFRQNNRFKEEADISDRYINFRDSLFTKQSAEKMGELESSYEAIQKNNKIALLQKEKEIQQLQTNVNRSRYIWSIIFIGFLALFGYWYINNKNRTKRQEQIEVLRDKISSDLHDDVGSLLTGLAMQAEILEMTAKPEAKGKLHRIHQMSRSALARIRDAVWALDSSKDNGIALADRMKDHLEDTFNDTGKTYNFKSEITSEIKLMPNIRQQVFLIFKECITNFIKHSNGNQVNVLIAFTDNKLTMICHDDGRVDHIKTSGIGINSISRRTESIDGNISFDTDDGYKVILNIPLDKK